jgi:hypothetical protein
VLIILYRYAGDMARKRNVPFKKTTPSLKWWRLLKKRHPKLTIRKPEATAAVRHDAMNEAYVKRYFRALETELKDVQPCYIWNLDETGFQLAHFPSSWVTR